MIRVTSGNPKVIDFIILDGNNVLVPNLPDATSIRFQVKRDRLDSYDLALISYLTHPKVLSEVIFTSIGAPVPPGNLASIPVIPESVVITDGVETFNDHIAGTLTGSLGGTGTIDYDTGAYTLNFATAPALDVTVRASYLQDITPRIQYDVPKTGWIRVHVASLDTALRPGDYYFALQVEWPTERIELTIGDGVLSVQQDTIR